MDKLLAARLTTDHKLYDSSLHSKVSKMTQQYIAAGLQTLDYYVADLDAANDIVQCYAPLSKEEFEKLDRASPQNFIHPMAATEITTLSTFISQILFGGQTARQVEARGDEDEDRAKVVNELLQWNDDQQPTYMQGYLWIWDTLTFNRGVMYDYWKEISEVELEEVQEEDPFGEPDEFGNKPTYSRFRKVRKAVGGYNHVHLVSPYDFILDPMLPAHRMQEARFAGHRVMIPWHELKRRSELPVDHYEYVLPEVVEKIKNRPSAGGSKVTNALSQPTAGARSRSYYERLRKGNPAGVAGGKDAVNKEDGGIIECFCLYVRISPKAYDMYDEEQMEIVEILTAGENEILSINVMPNTHDMYPYSVGEARPNAHYQYASGYALLIKPIQDYVDYLKNRHQESLARTSGNIFVADPTKIDFEAFTDPKKDGLIIPIKPEAAGQSLDSFFQQVRVQDSTANFHNEMLMWINTAETTTGSHAFMQGKTEDTSQTATQFVGVQQMGTGRISSIARLLSVQAMVPQTKRFVRNFQQFMPDEIIIRVTGDSENPDETQKTLHVKKDDIQAQFDYIPHDGSLQGTDARKVAALTRALEVFNSSPQFAAVFDSTKPGNLDPKKILFETLRASGMRIKNFIVNRQQAIENLKEQQLAAGQGMGMPPAAPEMPMGDVQQAPPEQVGGGLSIPSAGQLPPTPSAQPPQPNPAQM